MCNDETPETKSTAAGEAMDIIGVALIR